MAAPRDAEEEERRLDAQAREGTTAPPPIGSPAVPPTALPGAAAAVSNAAVRNARRSNLHGPPLPAAPAAATTVSGRRSTDATPDGDGRQGRGDAVSAGDIPQLHHNNRSGGPQPWGVGGGIGAAPYRANAPVFGLVGHDNDLLPSVLGPTDYAALLADGLGDATTLIGAGGGAPLQSHEERMEERARTAARRAVQATHAAHAAQAAAPTAKETNALGKPVEGSTEPAADTIDNRAPASHQHHHHGHASRHTHAGHQVHQRQAAAAGEAAPTGDKIQPTGAPAAAGGVVDAQKQKLGRDDVRAAAPPSPATCARGHCSPGVAHDVGYEHDL